MSDYKQVKTYVANRFKLELVLKQPTSGNADMKLDNYNLVNDLRKRFCGASITEDIFRNAFFSEKYAVDNAKKTQKKDAWPTIILAHNPENKQEYYGFIVYYAPSDTRKPIKIVALCTVGGNQCVGQSLLAAALAEQPFHNTWIVDMPRDLQKVSRFFNNFGFIDKGSSSDRILLSANTDDMDADVLINLLQNCNQANVAAPQLSVQAAVEVNEVKGAVAQGVQAALGVDQKQAENIAEAAVANAVSVNPSVPVLVPADVQQLADTAMAQATDALMSVALNDEKDASDGSSRKAVQALVKQTVAEAVLEPRSKLSRNQKIAALGVLAGGLVGLGGILRLVATKTKTVPPSRRKNRRS